MIWPPPAARAPRCSCPACCGAWVVVLRSSALTAVLTVAASVALAGSLAAPRRRRPDRRNGRRPGRRRARRRPGRRPRGARGSRGPVIGILLAIHLGSSAAADRDGLPGRRAPGDPEVGDQPHRRPAAGGSTARRAGHRGRSWSSRGSRPRSDSAHGAPGRARSSRGDRGPGIRSARVPGPSRVAAQAVAPRGRHRADAARRRCWSCRPRSPTRRRTRSCWERCFGVAAVLPLLVRRRWPFLALGAILAHRGRARPVDGPFRLPLMVALYTIGSPRSWQATIAAAAAVVAVGVVYRLAGGPESATGTGRPRAAVRGRRRHRPLRRQPAREHEALRERAERLTASASCSPSARSPRSGCGSRRSSTTSSPTTSG